MNTDTEDKTQKTNFFLEENFFLIFFVLKILLEIPKYFLWLHVCKQHNIKQLKRIDKKQYKTSNTLFVLGSGSSINELTKEQWKIIKDNDSMGLNFWLIHDYIPTYYMFENGDDADRSQILKELINIKSKKYKNTPFILKHIRPKNIDLYLSDLPQEIRQNFVSGYEFRLPGNLNSSLDKSVKFSNTFDLNRIDNLLFYRRASISQAISFALKMKYENIVLCGVDLNNTKYFYEEDIYYNLGIPIPKNVQSKSVHRTLSTTYGQITIDKVVLSMNKYLLKPNKANLYIGSRKSALYPRLPYYYGFTQASRISHE